MSRIRMLDADQLLTEEYWENTSEKDLDAVNEDNDDDFLFGEDEGNAEGPQQAALMNPLFDDDKTKPMTKKVGSASLKRKDMSKTDAILEAIAGVNRRIDEMQEENRGLKRSLKKLKKKQKE